MPRRTDIHRVMVIGSGPIVIGQACEFDYSGTPACQALRSEGPRGGRVDREPRTALNRAVELAASGTLAAYGVRLIGASVDAIKVAEVRLAFRDAMESIGIDVPASGLARTVADALARAGKGGFPTIIRPPFTLGGIGGGGADTPTAS